MSAARAELPGVNRTVKLSSNEGAFGVPPGAQAAHRRRRRRDATAIPMAARDALRAAIGARFGLDPARIVCGAGSDDLIYQLCLAYGGPGTRHRDVGARVLHLRRSPAPMPAAASSRCRSAT